MLKFIHSYRKLGTICLSIIEQKGKHHSFINAILFYTNRLTSGCRKQELVPGSISLSLLTFIDNDCDRHTVSFATRQTYIFKRKLGLDLSFFRKASGIFDV